MINANEFKNYLIQKGYSEFSKNGRRSTVYDYTFRVQRVCRAEQLSIKLFYQTIQQTVLNGS